MTIRRWFYLFVSTLGWGILAGLIVGVILISNHNEFYLWEISKPGFNVTNLINIVIAGAMFSVLSQMGFFSYLIVRYIAIGFIKNKRIWEIMQLILVAVTLFDIIYLRYTSISSTGKSLVGFFILPGILLLVALATAYWKMKLTKPSGFIPTLLFMFVVTILEAIPALRLNSPPSNIFMLTPLVVCNAWQILQLHRIIRNR
ncbi:MAG: KinB signaling pathway activation protein [Bacilli bacterium]|nr:KinB signaling pathway activation protein [Bacilli bacterium]